MHEPALVVALLCLRVIDGTVVPVHEPAVLIILAMTLVVALLCLRVVGDPVVRVASWCNYV